MKKLIKLSLLLLTLTSFGLTESMAQKFGYLNSGELLSMMPQAKAAESELAAYKTQLEKGLEIKVAAFQKKITDLQAKIPNMAPAVARQKQEELAEEEQELYAARTKGEQDVMKKREELLTPILERADIAVKAVGQENGFTFIFDSGSFNVLLFAEESTNVLPMVKAKLGL